MKTESNQPVRDLVSQDNNVKRNPFAVSGTAVAITIAFVLAGTGISCGKGISRHAGTAAMGDGLPARLFPKSSYWSKPVPSKAATDPASSRYVRYLNSKISARKGPFLAVRSYGVPVWVGRQGDPVERLGDCYRYSCPGIKDSLLRVPSAAKADPGSDGHMVLYDNNTATAYDLYDAVRQNGKWYGASAAAVDVKRGSGSTGTRNGATASHTALLAGLIRPIEIARGRIRHALAVTVPGIGPGKPRCPAQANVPTTDSTDAPPEGTRYVMNRNADLTGLSRTQKIIARALQRYGMIVTDNGGTVAFRGLNPIGKADDGWAAVGFSSGDSMSLAGLPMNDIRVVVQPTC